MPEFDRDILRAAEELFSSGDIKTLIVRAPGADQLGGEPVKVVHKSTGLEATCREYDSQVRNKVMALLIMKKKLCEDTHAD